MRDRLCRLIRVARRSLPEAATLSASICPENTLSIYFRPYNLTRAVFQCENRRHSLVGFKHCAGHPPLSARFWAFASRFGNAAVGRRSRMVVFVVDRVNVGFPPCL